MAPIYANTEVAQESTEVDNYAEEANESMSADEFMNMAREIYNEEAESDDREVASDQELEGQIFEYQFIDTENNLAYMYQNDDGEEAMSIYELEESEEDERTVAKQTNLGGGIGGKQRFDLGSNSYISCSVVLPDYHKVSATGDCYIYVGFTGGNPESDLGLLYSANNGGVAGVEAWKPYAKVGAVKVTSDSANYYKDPKTGVTYNEVTNKNGFKPGTKVTFYAYKNYDNTGKVRLKQMGTAIHNDRKGNGGEKYLTSIVEYPEDMSGITQGKVLCTIAGSESVKGSFSTTFSNVRIGSSTPSTWYTSEEDYATVRRSGSNVTISINK